MDFELERIAKNTLTGKILTGTQFNTDEELKSKGVFLPQQIINVDVGTSEDWEDAGLWLGLLDGERFFVFSNEVLYLQD